MMGTSAQQSAYYILTLDRHELADVEHSSGSKTGGTAQPPAQNVARLRLLAKSSKNSAYRPNSSRLKLKSATRKPVMRISQRGLNAKRAPWPEPSTLKTSIRFICEKSPSATPGLRNADGGTCAGCVAPEIGDGRTVGIR